MNNPRSNDDQSLGELLRREAQATEPEFSAALHARICHQVRQAKADTAVRTLGDKRTWWRLIPLAAAAVVALAAFVALRPEKLAEVPEPVELPAQGAHPASLAYEPRSLLLPNLADRAALEVDHMISEKLITEQLAYLEHDAQVLANAVTGGSLRSFFPHVSAMREAGPGAAVP